MAKPPTPYTKDAPFNMAMLFYIRLNSLMEKKDFAYTDGDVNKFYRCLKAIYRNIYFKIKQKPTVITEFKNNFKRAKDLLSGVCRGSIAQRANAINKIKAEEILEEIDSEILSAMDEYNMVFPKIDIIGGLDSIKKKFGIE